MPEVTAKCAVCAQDSSARVCETCSGRMRRQLSDLPELYALASAEYWPAGRGDGGSSPERSIGLRVAALDARTAAEATSVLEEWERDWRDAFNLAGEKGATWSQRQRKAAVWNSTVSKDLRGVSLVGVTKFLLAHLDRACQEHAAVDVFADELRALHRSARTAAREVDEPVTVVRCPADLPSGGVCRAELRLLDGDVMCPKCESLWSRARLLAVAQAAEVEVWLPAETVSLYLGVPGPTLRRWARDGVVRRRSGNYLWGTVVAACADRGREVSA